MLPLVLTWGTFTTCLVWVVKPKEKSVGITTFACRIALVTYPIAEIKIMARSNLGERGSVWAHGLRVLSVPARLSHLLTFGWHRKQKETGCLYQFSIHLLLSASLAGSGLQTMRQRSTFRVCLLSSVDQHSDALTDSITCVLPWNSRHFLTQSCSQPELTITKEVSQTQTSPNENLSPIF